MSVIIALDPNVLIATLESDMHSRYAIQTLIRFRTEYCLGLDPDAKILDAYTALTSKLAANDITKTFISLFLDRSQKRLKSINTALLHSNEIKWLLEHECVTPVEPELIAVAKAAPADSCMIVVAGSYKSDGLAGRGTDSNDTIEWLHKTFTSIRIYPVSAVFEMLTLMKRSRYPGNQEHLQLFLTDNENEFIEFKQPTKKDVNGLRSDSTRLTSSIINKSLEAVCAMVNTEGGKVIVGVNNNGIIIGIDLLDLTGNQTDDDQLSRLFTDRFTGFNPSVNCFVKPSVVPLSNGRRVIILHVEKGSEQQRYTYHGKYYDRCGPSNRKTIPDR